MNYDTIIIEMLARIQKLEEEVKLLKNNTTTEIPIKNETNKVKTKDICEFINSLKELAFDDGQSTLTLIANDIHKELNLKSRMPLVCNAMKQCMLDDDEIIFETESGYSSTLEIKYDLNKWLKTKKEKEGTEMLWDKITTEFAKSPRNVKTQPTDNREPKWFYVSAENNSVFVESGRNTTNDSKISGKRFLERDKLETMLDLYNRRKNGESVSTAASTATQNQVYWYGIFAELGL